MLLAVAAAASLFVAQPDPPQRRSPTIIVSVLWEKDGRDAEEFLAALPTEKTADGVPLRELLGHFTRAEPLFPFHNPAPDVYEIPETTADWLLKRYIKISYPMGFDTTPQLQSLSRTGKFGYVGTPPEIDHLAVPTDPHWNLANGQPAPYGGQNWAHQRLNLPNAWDYLLAPSGLSPPHTSVLTGGTRVAVLDNGVYLQPLVPGNCDRLPHEDLIANLRPQMSIGTTRTVPFLSPCYEFEPFPIDEIINPGGHGTHVLGLISATANNGLGGTGVCWSCPTGIATEPGNPTHLEAMLRQAPAVISLSFGFPNATRPVCNFQSSDHPWCPLLQLAEERDQIIVAAAGNDLTLTKFPAYHFTVMGIGGLGATVDGQGRPRTWDDRTTSGGAGCPTLPPVSVPPGWLGPSPVAECGTNDDASRPLAFFAPAKDILSSMGPSYIWNQEIGCTDGAINSNIPERPGWRQFAPLQYDYCTGTSMSAPLMAGAVALARSVHPVLDRGTLIQMLRQSRTAVVTATGVRDGLLDTAAAIKSLLGEVGAAQLQNRLTPVLVLRNTLDGTFQIPSHGSWLFTTSPQVAYAAMGNTLYAQMTDSWMPLGSWAYNQGFGPSVKTHRIDETGIRNFRFNVPFDAVHAGAYFFVYTTPKNPFGSQSLRPLYRLSFDDMFNNNGIP